MPARTLGTIAAAISRHTRGEVPFGEILQAIQDASVEIQSKYDWPWTWAEANIQLQPTYNVGTITVADGSTNVLGTGTAWDTAWRYKTLQLGDYTYPIASVGNTQFLELKQGINQGQSFTDAGYTIFQQDYPLPDDCEFGSITMIVNPLYRYRLRYIPRYTLERQAVWVPSFFTNFTMSFADGGRDDTTKKSLLRVTPPPSEAGDYRLVYRRRVPDLSALADQTLIPQSFDRVIELMAEYLVRLNRPTPMPGWMEKKAEAYQLLQAMRKKMSTVPLDNYPGYQSYPTGNVSFYDPGSGAFVGPVSGSE